MTTLVIHDLKLVEARLVFAAYNLLLREKEDLLKCQSRPHASLVHFSLGKKMAAVPVVSTAHLHFNDVFLSTYGHLLSYASLTTLLINSTMEWTPSGIKSRYRRQVNKGENSVSQSDLDKKWYHPTLYLYCNNLLLRKALQESFKKFQECQCSGYLK